MLSRLAQHIISASLYERSANGIELSLVPSVCPHMWAVATRLCSTCNTHRHFNIFYFQFELMDGTTVRWQAVGALTGALWCTMTGLMNLSSGTDGTISGTPCRPITIHAYHNNNVTRSLPSHCYIRAADQPTYSTTSHHWRENHDVGMGNGYHGMGWVWGLWWIPWACWDSIEIFEWVWD